MVCCLIVPLILFWTCIDKNKNWNGGCRGAGGGGGGVLLLFWGKLSEVISQRKLILGNAHFVSKDPAAKQAWFLFPSFSCGCCSISAGKHSVWKEKLIKRTSEMLTGKDAFVQTVVKYYLYLACCCKQSDFPLDGPPYQTLNMFPCKHGNNFLALNFTSSFVNKLSIPWFT